LGALVWGVAHVIGAPLTIVVGAVVVLVCAVLFWMLVPQLRRLS